MKLSERHKFTGEMDLETAGSEYPENRWSYSLGLWFQNAFGNNGIAVTAKGTLLFAQMTEFLTDYHFVWQKYDPQTDYIYFLVRYSNNTQHAIYRCNREGEVELVINSSLLESYTDREIKAVSIFDGNIYWCEFYFQNWVHPKEGNVANYTQTKHVNIDMALRYTDSGGTDPLGYTTLSYESFLAIKSPPKLPLVLEYNTDEEFQYNRISKQTFQFAYRYVYRSGNYSLYSPFSKLAANMDNELMDGSNRWSITKDNSISITYNSGKQEVIRIEFAVKQGNNGVFGVFKVVDKDEDVLANDTEYTFLYYGTETLLTVPDVDLVNYDLLPDIAQGLSLLRNNTLAYANMIEGYDNPELDVSVSLLQTRMPELPPTYGNPTGINSSAGAVLADACGAYVFPDGWINLPVGAFIQFRMRKLDDCSNVLDTGTPVFFTYEIQDGDITGTTTNQKLLSLAQAIDAGLEASYPTIEFVWFDVGDFLPVPDGIGFIVGCHTVQGDPIIILPVIKEFTFKDNCYYDIGILYSRYGNKTATVVRNDEMRVFVPDGNEFVPSGLTIGYSWKTQLAMQLSHYAPTWATHWEVVMRERLTVLSQLQVTVNNAVYDNGRVKLELEHIYRQRYSAGYNYTPQIGDTVRFLKQYDTTLNEIRWLEEPNLQFNVTAVSLGGGVDGADILFVEYFDIGLYNIPGMLIEISRVKKTGENDPYYSVGEKFTIKQPHSNFDTNRTHDSQTYSVKCNTTNGSAVVTFTGNMPYLVGRDILITGLPLAPFNVTSNCVATSYDAPSNTTSLTLAAALNQTTNGVATLSVSLSQTMEIPGVVVIDGDTIIRNRVLGSGYSGGLTSPVAEYSSYWVHSDNISDFYESHEWSKGRIHLYSRDAKQEVYDNLIRASLVAFSGKVNNMLNRFLQGNQQLMPVYMGSIKVIYSRGMTLRVGQTGGWTSIYIDTSVAYRPTGVSDMAYTKATLGDLHPGEVPFGIQQAEASIDVNGDIYIFDSRSGVLVKDTNGGAFVINNGLDWYLRKIANDVEINNYLVRMGHDPSRGLVYISFIDTSTVENSVTIAFSEGQRNEWKGFEPFVPQGYFTNKKDMLTMPYGDNKGLWKHGVGQPCVFYDEEFNAEIHFYASVPRGIEKTPLALFIDSDVKPESVLVLAEANATYAAQETTATVKKHGDGYWAKINMNRKTPGPHYNDDVNLFVGKPLKASYFLIKIVFPKETDAKLRGVNLYTNLSEEAR